jgi:hypothetical protein
LTYSPIERPPVQESQRATLFCWLIGSLISLITPPTGVLGRITIWPMSMVTSWATNQLFWMRQAALACCASSTPPSTASAASALRPREEIIGMLPPAG